MVNSDYTKRRTKALAKLKRTRDHLQNRLTEAETNLDKWLRVTRAQHLWIPSDELDALRLHRTISAIFDIGLTRNATREQPYKIGLEERLMATTLREGATYFVSAPIVKALLEGPYKTVPEDTRIAPEMFPTPRGVVFLGLPYDTDIFGRHNHRVLGLMWDTTHTVTSPFANNLVSPAVMVSSIVFLDRPDDTIGGLAVSPEFYTAWRFRDTLNTADIRTRSFADNDKDDPEAKVGRTSLYMLATLLLFMQQELLTAHKTRVQTSRVLPKLKLPPTHTSEVNVIQLRRIHRDTEPAHRTVDWQVQWMVRGHWRRYDNPRYSEKLRGTPQWINPYTKGPEDKPLRVSTNIFAVKR